MSKLDQVLANLDTNLDAAVERLFTFLRIPSISTDPAYKKDCVKAAEHLKADLATLGFEASLRPTKGHPVVLAHAKDGAKDGAKSSGKRPHMLFYGHYDVQPVDPLDLWTSPPFEPRLAEIEPGRKAILARGACDDKGQAMTFIEACRAWKAVTGSLPIDITLLVEGEEECGSINLPAFVEANKAELKADAALVCDTGMWDRKTPAITSALRGLVYEEVKIIAADRDLHSGIFGGGAANPINVLTKILGGLRDGDGRITLPGFYEGVHELPSQLKADWVALNLTPEQFLGQVGLKLPVGEKGRELIEMVQSRPTCDINGIWGGYEGEGSKTVIPSHASAKVSFRLVGDQDPKKISAAFEKYVRDRLLADCKAEFIHHASSKAIALPGDSKLLIKAREALLNEWGKAPVTIGSGGSVPIVGDFKRMLGIDSLLVGFGLDDDRVHSPNEKYDLSSFHHGMRSWARILGALAA
jgi:acetylornithine deacetylase/succinyl-diaminopimelate desuccinylase-like protein